MVETIRQDGHIYYFDGEYSTLEAARKAARSWQDYGVKTVITSRKAHYEFPKATRNVFRLYKTHKK